MRRIVMVLASAALVLGVVLGVFAWQGQAGAQDLPSLHALKNQSPIVKMAACNGYTGGCGCAPGWVSSCRRRCCACVRCY
jgi:hypothetical protein